MYNNSYDERMNMSGEQEEENDIKTSSWKNTNDDSRTVSENNEITFNQEN